MVKFKTQHINGIKLKDPYIKLERCDKKKQQRRYVGAHTSIVGSLSNAPKEAHLIGAKAFGLFLKSQRQWVGKKLTDQDAEEFKNTCKQYGYQSQFILPHGSYIMNCGSPDSGTLEKSRAALVDELQRCEKLGLTLYNFHPGSTCGKISVDECLQNIADSINLAHTKTKNVILVIENMSCQGNTVGGKFEELRGIIDRVHNKSRVGVCLDTCHAFAAGYDIRTAKGFGKMMTEFEKIVGIHFLKSLHLNDSKGDVGCHLDRHENIGKGKIGLATFECIMNDNRFTGIPMILETPMTCSDTEEIKTLYSLVKTKI